MFFFLELVAASVPKDFILTIIELDLFTTNFDVSQLLTSPEISSIYNPLIIIFVFYVVLYVFYFIVNYCWCCGFEFLEKKVSKYIRYYLLFDFILVSMAAVVGLSMLINGNNKLNHGYTLLKQLSYDILSLLNDVVVSSESCSLINQNEQFQLIISTMDTINNTIQETDSAYSSYSPIYFIVTNLLYGLTLAITLVFMVTILAQNNIVYPKTIKAVRTGTGVYLVAILTGFLFLIIIYRIPSFSAAVICLPSLAQNVLTILDESGIEIDDTISEMVNFYLLCDGTTQPPENIGELIDTIPTTSQNECSDVIEEIQNLVLNCTSIHQLIKNGETAFCYGIGEPVAQIYVAVVLFIFSTLTMLIINAFYQGVIITSTNKK